MEKVPMTIDTAPVSTAPIPTAAASTSCAPVTTGVPGARPVCRAASGVTTPAISSGRRIGGSLSAQSSNS
jgi:hypothetical protein